MMQLISPPFVSNGFFNHQLNQDPLPCRDYERCEKARIATIGNSAFIGKWIGDDSMAGVGWVGSWGWQIKLEKTNRLSLKNSLFFVVGMNNMAKGGDFFWDFWSITCWWWFHLCLWSSPFSWDDVWRFDVFHWVKHQLAKLFVCGVGGWRFTRSSVKKRKNTNGKLSKSCLL